MTAILTTLQQWDADILLVLNGFHCAELDSVMYFLTGKFVWLPLYIMLAVLTIRCLGWRNAVLSFLLVAATIAITDQICGSVIRPLAMRLRPSNPDNPLSQYVYIVNDYRGGRYGMASCHAGNCFALAVFLIRTLRWKRPVALTMLFWASLVTYTRIYLGVHYPGDIIVGAGVGIVTALGTSTLYFRLTSGALIWHRFIAGIPVIWQRIVRLP